MIQNFFQVGMFYFLCSFVCYWSQNQFMSLLLHSWPERSVNARGWGGGNAREFVPTVHLFQHLPLCLLEIMVLIRPLMAAQRRRELSPWSHVAEIIILIVLPSEHRPVAARVAMLNFLSLFVYRLLTKVLTYS